MSNAMLVIFPYKSEEIWAFDDVQTGLIREPFVFGVPEIIDRLVTDIPNAEQGFKLLFSASPFPSYQTELTWIREEYGGNWYCWQTHQMEGWLCPALFKYFVEAPLNLYCKAEPKAS